MDDDDYLYLIERVRSQLREAGAADLADERYYSKTDPETGETFLLAPQDHLLELLMAFGPFMAVRDRSTLMAGLNQINRTLDGEGPKGAFVERASSAPDRDKVRDRAPINLMEAPDLSKPRKALETLVEALGIRHTPGGLTL